MDVNEKIIEWINKDLERQKQKEQTTKSALKVIKIILGLYLGMWAFLFICAVI